MTRPSKVVLCVPDFIGSDGTVFTEIEVTIESEDVSSLARTLESHARIRTPHGNLCGTDEHNS